MKMNCKALSMRMGQVCLNNFKTTVLLLLFCVSVPALGIAQSSKDTLKIVFEVSGWVANETQMEFTFDLSPYNLDPESKPKLDLDGSWFILPNDSYTHHLLWDTTAQELYLRLTRASGTASGIGKVATVGGLVIMDDIMAKYSVPGDIMDPDTRPMAGPNPYVKGTNSTLTFSSNPDSAELWTMDGKKISSHLVNISNMVRDDLQPGLYLLKLKKEGEVYNQYLQIRE